MPLNGNKKKVQSPVGKLYLAFLFGERLFVYEALQISRRWSC